jgi:hypothetical protein
MRNSHESPPSALQTDGYLASGAGRLVPQLADVLIPLLGREASGCGASPVDGVLDVQVPEPMVPSSLPLARVCPSG